MTQTDSANLITDLAGLRVGNAQDDTLRSGVTVVTAAEPFVAAVHVMGGAPGTRDTDLLAPENMVDRVDALVLSGGSAFGLAAATGVADALRARGRGFEAAGHRVPIVPAAILFDLAGGGDSGWSQNPYPALGHAAFEAAAETFAQGSVGAGTGATTATLRGGLGSASTRLPDGTTVGALVAANPVGTVCDSRSGRFWAAPFEQGGEFGARGLPPAPEGLPTKLGAPGQATTLAIVATDAALTKSQAKRMAVAAHDGFARAILPSHTPFDGDLVFALSTGARPAPDPAAQMWLGHAAATCVARAIARAVFHARARPGDPLPAWRDRY